MFLLRVYSLFPCAAQTPSDAPSSSPRKPRKLVPAGPTIAIDCVTNTPGERDWEGAVPFYVDTHDVILDVVDPTGTTRKVASTGTVEVRV